MDHSATSALQLPQVLVDAAESSGMPEFSVSLMDVESIELDFRSLMQNLLPVEDTDQQSDPLQMLADAWNVNNNSSGRNVVTDVAVEHQVGQPTEIALTDGETVSARPKKRGFSGDQVVFAMQLASMQFHLMMGASTVNQQSFHPEEPVNISKDSQASSSKTNTPVSASIIKSPTTGNANSVVADRLIAESDVFMVRTETSEPSSMFEALETLDVAASITFHLPTEMDEIKRSDLEQFFEAEIAATHQFGAKVPPKELDRQPKTYKTPDLETHRTGGKTPSLVDTPSLESRNVLPTASSDANDTQQSGQQRDQSPAVAKERQPDVTIPVSSAEQFSAEPKEIQQELVRPLSIVTSANSRMERVEADRLAESTVRTNPILNAAAELMRNATVTRRFVVEAGSAKDPVQLDVRERQGTVTVDIRASAELTPELREGIAAVVRNLDAASTIEQTSRPHNSFDVPASAANLPEANLSNTSDRDRQRRPVWADPEQKRNRHAADPDSWSAALSGLTSSI
jgi:hypothetical protein